MARCSCPAQVASDFLPPAFAQAASNFLSPAFAQAASDFLSPAFAQAASDFLSPLPRNRARGDIAMAWVFLPYCGGEGSG